MFMLFLMSMISRLFAVRLCSSVVSLFTVGHVRCFIYYLGELMGLIACPYPSIVYEALFLRAVVRLAAAATKMLAILALARHLIFTVIRPCLEFIFVQGSSGTCCCGNLGPHLYRQNYCVRIYSCV